MTRASARSTSAVSAAGSTAPTTQRQKLAAATRQRIFRIAIAEFSDKGLSGARVETIASRSKVNIRMIYHYFGGKEALYLEVLEFVLARLREAELKLKLDIDRIDPVTAIVQLYDFIEGHFAAHPELAKLLSFENLNRARVMKRSSAIPEMSSPVLTLLRTVIARGEEDGSLRRDMDPLHLYVALVSLCSFHKSNAYTLSRIFNTDMLAAQWQEDHKAQAHEMVRAFVMAGASQPALPKRARAQIQGA
ncbi:transcriptional regulator [Burkholderia sp. Ch1-1]|uniref:Transcriptional regulator n=1 Tax=Paraburkholderia dioscoreae TaxID=2604047 RepID=A0A5Q4ZI65_9BURK|nr:MULTISPECIES: TetR/AcrR family transcriptional regulator [Paraburkholderia]EIF34107.1 transcriptional regulator [Burkholderia sp. Ch1-1]MDR8396041.1 TetR/AcrR family transcriptional regulator [Paraburkholderia sp. USG1]VVD33023.1 Transcriptional regulator [Paraburkholderia dioscoreae]